MLLRSLPIFCGLLAACASSNLEVRKAVPPEDFRVSTAVVYPVLFQWEEPAYRSLELAQRQVDALLTDGRLLVLGPAEIQVSAWEEEPFGGSNVSKVVRDAGLELRSFVVLRVSVDQSVARSSVKIDKKGKGAGQIQVEDRTLIITMEIIHPASRKKLFVLETRKLVDPFSENRPDYDPLPELTETVEELTRLALGMLGDLDAIHTRDRREPGFSYVASPYPSFSKTPDTRPTLLAELTKLDPLSADVLLDSRIRYAAPSVDEDTLRRLYRAKRGGVVVLSVEEQARKAGLEVGDVITAVDDQPVLGPQVLERQLRKAGPGRLSLRFDRSGVERHGVLDLK